MAASSGDGATGRGWPDALSAGPWCGAANGAAVATQAPVRALAPLTGEQPGITSTTPASPHGAVPVLLVPAGATTLPASVRQLLAGAFEPTDSFCSSVQALPGCVMPGFVVAVGGASVLPSALITSAAQLVAGGAPPSGATPPPALDQPFYTSLDLAPVYATNSALPDHVCVARDSYVEARWIAILGAAPSTSVIADTDAMLDGRYVRDADGITRSRGIGAPVCASLTNGTRTSLRARGVGIAGRVGPERTFATAPSDRFQLTAPVTDVRPGRGQRHELERRHLQRRFDHPDLHHARTRRRGGLEGLICTRDIGIDHFHDHRGTDLPSAAGVDQFSATTSIDTPNGTVTTTAIGEALFVGGVWRMRGRTSVVGGSWNFAAGSGGFVADLDTGASPAPTDDSIAWRLDALADG